MRTSLLFAVAVAFFGLALAGEVLVPEILTSQVDKITKIITLDEKACQGLLNDVQLEINKRHLIIRKYEKQVQTVCATFDVSQAQLKNELVAIRQVKHLVLSLSSSSSSFSSSDADSANQKISSLDQQESSAKMANVLRNIVTSVTSGSAASSLDLSEVVNLINDLEENIQNALETNSVSTQTNTFNEKIAIEKAALLELHEKKLKTSAECSRRRSEFTEVLAVLKLIEQKYQNVSIPSCQPALDEKERVTSSCRREKEALERKLADTEDSLNTCQQAAPTDSECRTDLARSNADVDTLTKRVQELEHFEAEVKSSYAEADSLQQRLTKLSSQKASIEADLADTRQELQEANERAQCRDAETRIHQLQNRVHEMSIKVELGEKCAINYKSQATENSELVKQLEKMTVLHTQLESCQYESSKAAKECSESALQASSNHAQAIDKLTSHIQELHTEISRLQDEAKCMNERTVIEKYEKEVITLKAETKTVVTQVEAEHKGCQAELESYKASSGTDAAKLNDYYNKVASLEQQLKIVQADHSNCVDANSKNQAQCRGIAADLDKCQSDYKAEVARLQQEHALKISLHSEEKSLVAKVRDLVAEESSLKSEVTSLTAKIAAEETKISSLQAEIAQHESSEKAITETKNGLQEVLEKHIQKVNKLENKIQHLEVKVQGQNAGNTALLAELRKLHSERESVLVEKVEVETQLKKAELQAAALRDFKEAAIQHLREARSIITNNDRKIDELTTRISNTVSTRTSLQHRLSTCHAHVKSAESAISSLQSDLASCHSDNADLETQLASAQQEASCSAHKVTISELKKHGYSLRVEIKSLLSIKQQLAGRVSSLEAKLQSWEELNRKLQSELAECGENHAGCRASVRSLKNQMLSHLRKIKHHVSATARLEEKLAAHQVELSHTRKQWHADRASYRAFKDNLLEQMTKLIALAKEAKRNFDVARSAAKNELKVQDAQWGVCRKEVLNYERILGSGVVKAEKEKMKAYLATKRYIAIKADSEAAIQRAQALNQENRDQLKAIDAATKKLDDLRKGHK